MATQSQAPAGLPLAAAWGLPERASAEGARIDHLLAQTALLTGLALLALTGWLLWAVLRRGRRGDLATSPRRTVLLALALFGLIDGDLLYQGLRDVRGVFWSFATVDAEPDVVRVEVDAHQWAWDFRQAGPDGAFGTADDVVQLHTLVVPAGRPVLLALSSADVVHSLYLPSMRVKADAVPGRLGQLWFRPEREGEYELGCAQHCGAGHYRMRGTLRVLSPQAYAEWLARQAGLAALAYDPADQAAHWGWPWRAP